MLNDPLANVMSAIVSYEKTGKRELLVNPLNKVIRRVLAIMQEYGYIGNLEELSAGRGGFAKLHLMNHVNKCGVIKPRFAIQADEFQKFEKRYLPAAGVGILIISTPEGIMTHEQAREKGIGGRLLAYCY